MNIKLFMIATISLANIAMPAQAQSGGLRFLHDTPITKFNEADTKLLFKALDQALDNGEDGEPVTWANPSTNSSGRITPSKDPQGRSDCRKARVENRHQTLSNATDAIFCKVDGKWKVDSK